MTHVLHVDHSAVFGGAERSVLELARAQRARGMDARVAVGRAGPFSAALADAGVPTVILDWHRSLLETPSDARVARLAGGTAAVIDAALKLRRAARDLEPDIVQAHTRKAQLVASFARSGAPLVWHLRDDVPSRSTLRVILRTRIRSATHAVALSTWLADHYRAEGLLPRSGAIDIVPSGVDPEPLVGLDNAWLDGRRPPVVGFVGQIAGWKAPHLLVDVAEQLPDLPDVTFAIVGDVWFRHADRGYGEWLERRVAETSEASRIQRLSTRAPADALAAMDVLVHTSVEPEPFGRVIVEAMMAGRPIVAFRRGAPLELLDGATATFADGFDAPALAAAVRAVIQDPDAARTRAEAARVAAMRFTPDRVADAMDRAYKRLIR